MKRKRKSTLKSILEKSRYVLKNSSRDILESDYKRLKAKANRTKQVFKKHGKGYKLPQYLQEGLKGVAKLSTEELVSYVSRLSNFLKGETRSYAAYKRAIDKRKSFAEETLDYEFESDADFETYEKFMHEMYIRDKDNWKYHYDDAMDLFIQARRLKLDPMQFAKNYDYWLEHAESLEEAVPIENRRKLYPSDYARQLKLPKIRGGFQ